MAYPIKTLQQLRPVLVGFRKDACLSQAAVAGLLGITQQSYAKIEANPSATNVERLFTVLRLLGAEIVLAHNEKSSVHPCGQAEVQKSMLPDTSLPIEKPAPLIPRKMLPPTAKKESW